MTNWAWLAMALLATAGAASAHGAPEPRDIETRIATDTTDAGDYGAQGVLDEGAWDLLSLDAREARDQDGQPMVVFRITMQSDTASADREVSLAMDAPAGRVIATIREAEGWSVEGAARLAGPEAVGDGHPKAVDVWFDAARIGAGAGTQLTGIVARSNVSDQPGDIMPGSWWALGQRLPVPGDTAEGVSYTLAGPAGLLAVAPEAVEASGPRVANGSITLRNPTTHDQFVQLRWEGAPGVVGGLREGVALAAGASRDIGFTLHADAGTTQQSAITGWSSLGGWFRVPVTVTNTSQPDNSTAPPTTGTSASTAPANGAPGAGAVWLAGVGAAAVAVRRWA